jgi:YD repeat-containing protein
LSKVQEDPGLRALPFAQHLTSQIKRSEFLFGFALNNFRRPTTYGLTHIDRTKDKQMAGVISGNGLGWFNSSMTQLGRSLGGRTSIGGGNESQYVNVANGNLVLSGLDDQLQYRDHSLNYVRTYNSQGALGTQNWMFGFESRLQLNTTTNRVTRTGEDGSSEEYLYNTSTLRYESTVGDGAHDYISIDANSQFVWTEGSSGIVETFSTGGYLQSRRDRVGTKWTFLRDKSGAENLYEIKNDSKTNAETISISRDADGRINFVQSRLGVFRGFDHGVGYTYDALGRLSSVSVHLDTGPVTTTSVLTTSYTYHGNTNRIASVTEPGGVKTSFIYDTTGRVASVTVGTGIDARVTNYDYSIANQTTVSIGSESWIYKYDVKKQLTEVQSSPVGGLRMVTRFGYDDATGNLSFEERGHITGTSAYVSVERTDFDYDTRGNLIWERDALGNSIKRDYDLQNKLVALARFRDRDPDAGGAERPSQAMTSRWIYDAAQRLRFEISETGGVTEYVYDYVNGQGIAVFGSEAPNQVRRTIISLQTNFSGAFTLSALETWALQNNGPVKVSDFSYDVRGLLMFEERHALNSVTEIDRLTSSVSGLGLDPNTSVRAYLGDTEASFIAYTYDGQGLLSHRSVFRGNDRTNADTETFVYDGAGRLLSSSLSSSSLSGARNTSYSYDDIGNRIVTTSASGLVRTEARNTAGELISMQEGPSNATNERGAKNFYDAKGQLIASRDFNGVMSYMFYDDAGRLHTMIDGTGEVTQRTFDFAGRELTSTQLATRINTSSWYNASTGVLGTISLPTLTLDADKDRTTTSVYNIAGQLLSVADGEGKKTAYGYDGAGRVTLTTLSNLQNADTRRVRNFYDNAGRLLGSLDSENYLTRHSYDAAGRLIKTVASAERATVTTGTVTLETASLAQLQTTPRPNDQTTRYYYSAKGELIATLDAEGYLTTRTLDEAQNYVYTRRYSQKQNATDTTTLQSLVANVAAGTLRESQTIQNAAGEVTEVRDGALVTRYEYDTSGRLTNTQVIDQLEYLGVNQIQNSAREYNIYGELVREVSPEGVEMRHRYNALGQRFESTDILGNATWYVYDTNGRLQYTVAGVENASGQINRVAQVTETRYNAFGEISSSLAYTGLLSLSGNFDYAAALSLVASLPGATANDVRQSYTYNKRGQLTSETDPRDVAAVQTQIRKTLDYNGFGELKRTTLSQAINGAIANKSTDYIYDKRGSLLETRQDVTALNLISKAEYDAFGRVVKTTDAKGAVRTMTYDRLGRQVQVSQFEGEHVEAQSMTYDAYARVLTQIDALGRETIYHYEPAGNQENNLVMQTNTPEGVVISTISNAQGMTLKTTDSAGNGSTFAYNRDGQLLSVTDANEKTSTQTYDSRGLLFESTDATGVKTRLTYDAQARVILRTESASVGREVAGLNLKTYYAYDALGRQVSMTDGSGRVTKTSYDPAGNVLTIERGDSANPTLGYQKTTMTYDAQGKVLTVTEGDAVSARTVEYRYDGAGRRTQEIVDPAGLKITTTYTYDQNGNVIARQNAKYGTGSTATNVTPDGVTRYVYDEANRVVFMVDQNNAVTRYFYDKNGRQVGVRSYAKLPALEATLNVANVTTAVDLVASDLLDVSSFTVYDKDGRARFQFAASGQLTEYRYNTLGQLKEMRVGKFLNAISAAERTALQAGATSINGTDAVEYIAAGFDTTDMRRSAMAYDAVGRLSFTLVDIGNEESSVSENVYDAAGRLTEVIRYSQPASYSENPQLKDLQPASDADRRRSIYIYDAAGRLHYTLEETRFDPNTAKQYYSVSEIEYDGAGRVRKSSQYLTELANLTEFGDSQITSALTINAITRATITTEYDAAGRKSKQFDQLDEPDRFEKFTYDASGLLLTYTDREGAVWAYGYDKAGRKVLDKSPEVEVVLATATGTLSGLKSSRAIYTEYVYDALGNLTLKRDDARVDTSVPAATFRTRETEYRYDNRGFQIETIFPIAGELDANGVNLTVSGERPSVKVTYDALGRAVVQQDTRGYFSYKTYDVLGRLRFEMDQERYVTEYIYNRFGEVEKTIRYAERATLPTTGWGAGLPLSMAQMDLMKPSFSNAFNRSIETKYDKRGQKESVTQDAVTYYRNDGTSGVANPKTEYKYDVLGRLVSERVLLEFAADGSERWAETFHYYDEANRKVMTVDAERYVTTMKYDARGNVLQTIEYAERTADQPSVHTMPVLPPNSIKDRISTWTYDKASRRSSEVSLGITTEFTHDKEGRLRTSTISFEGGSYVMSDQRYDALGRMRELRGPAHKVVRNNIDFTNVLLNVGDESTLETIVSATGYNYDAFGNVVAAVQGGFKVITGDKLEVYNGYRQTLMRHDNQGRTISEREGYGDLVEETLLKEVYGIDAPLGLNTSLTKNVKTTWRKYDPADNVVESHYKLSTDGIDSAADEKVSTYYGFDSVNRQVSTDVIRTFANSETYRDQTVEVTYNAFGEIGNKKVLGTPTLIDSRDYSYDHNGRLISSDDNEQGVVRQFGFNLAGQKNFESRPLASGGAAVYSDKLDLLGRATISVLPRNNNADTPVLQRQFDRWGNVLTFRDANANLTEFSYNNRNQVLTEMREAVTVVNEFDQASVYRPTLTNFYDALGRLREATDANGVTRKTQYDITGVLTRREDGEQGVSRFTYDGLGQQRYAQDARGHITYQNHDALGFMQAQGDFMPSNSNAALRTQHMLQSYVLNQNGVRLKVTNGEWETQRYKVNSRGEITQARSAQNVETYYRYDEMGRKVFESNAQASQTWSYDTKGRMDDRDPVGGVDRDHVDLGGRVYNYSYNAQGLQSTLALGDQTRTMTYYDNGQVRKVEESNGSYTEYRYDHNGNLVEETNFVNNALGVLQSHTRTDLTYDKNNRIDRVSRFDVIENRYTLDLKYSYDAVGNRRKIEAYSGYGPTASPSFPVQGPFNAQFGVPFTFDVIVLDPDSNPTLAGFFKIPNSQQFVLLPNASYSWVTMTSTVNTAGQKVARFSGTVPQGQATQLTFKVLANDGENPAVETQVLLNVSQAAAPPTGSIPSITAATNDPSFTTNLRQFFTSANNNANALSFTATGLPSGFTLDTNGTMRRIPGSTNPVPRAYEVRVIARDTVSNIPSAEVLFTFTIMPQTVQLVGITRAVNNQTYFNADLSNLFSPSTITFTQAFAIDVDGIEQPLNSIAQSGASFEFLGGPGFARFGNVMPRVGTHLIRIKGTRNNGEQIVAQFTLTITNGQSSAPEVYRQLGPLTLPRDSARSFSLRDYMRDLDSSLRYQIDSASSQLNAYLENAGNDFASLELRPSANSPAGQPFQVSIRAIENDPGLSSPASVVMTVEIIVADPASNVPRLLPGVAQEHTFVKQNGQGTKTINFPIPYFDPDNTTLRYEVIPQFNQNGIPYNYIDSIRVENGNVYLNYEVEDAFSFELRAIDASNTSNISSQNVIGYVGLPSIRLTGPVLRHVSNQGLEQQTLSVVSGQPISGYSVANYFGPSGTNSTNPTLSFRAEGLPAGISIDSAGLITGSSTAAGTYTVVVTATQRVGTSLTKLMNVSTTLKIVVGGGGGTNPNPPTFTLANLGNLSFTRGQQMSLNVAQGFSAPGHNLTFNLLSPPPPGLSFENGVLSGRPTVTNSYPLQVQASIDGTNVSTVGNFTIVVNPPAGNEPPTGGGSRRDIERVIFSANAATNKTFFFTPDPGTTFFNDDAGPAGLVLEVYGNTVPTTATLEPDGRIKIVMSYPQGIATYNSRIRAKDAQGLINVPGEDMQLKVEVGENPNRISTADGKTKTVALNTTSNLSGTNASGGVLVPNSNNKQEYWFTYDRENRVRISNGELRNGQVQVAGYRAGHDQSVQYAYDAMGNKIGTTHISSGGQRLFTQQTYDLRGQLLQTFSDIDVATGLTLGGKPTSVTEQRIYDQAGRLTATFEFFGAETYYQLPPANLAPSKSSNAVALAELNVSGWVRAMVKYVYNDDGQLTEQKQFARPNGTQSINNQTYTSWAVQANRYLFEEQTPGVSFEQKLARQMGLENGALSTSAAESYRVLSSMYASTNLYDGLGRVYQYNQTTTGVREGYTASPPDLGIRYQYDVSYEAWDTYQESSVFGRAYNGNTIASNFAAGSTTSFYDSFGRRTEITEETRLSGNQTSGYKREFANSIDGRILNRKDSYRKAGASAFTQSPEPSETLFNPVPHLLTNAQWMALGQSDAGRTQQRNLIVASRNQRYVYAAGNQVASLSRAGNMQVASFATGFSSGENGSSSVQVMQGENLRAIARRIYGAEELWYILASANGLQDANAELTAATMLIAPDVTTNLNGASTFRPYRPGELSGSTTPALPYIAPPPKAGCNPLQIIVIIVAAIATVYTAGAATGLFGTATAASGATLGGSVLAGTASITTTTALGTALGTTGSLIASAGIGGFVGSVAGQLTSRALGLTDSFSLRQAVAGGLTAGIGAGIGSAVTLGGWQGAAVTGALNTVGGYAANKIAGVDNTHFSWRSVAANAVAAGITSAAMPSINRGLGITGLTEASQFASDVVSRTVGGVVSMHTRRAFGLGDRVDYGSIAADAFGNAVANQLTGEATARARLARGMQDLQRASDRLKESASAGTNSVGAPADPLDLIRINPDFQSAMSKFGKPTLLYNGIIDQLFYASDSNSSYVSESFKLRFEAPEVKALSDYFLLIGIERDGGARGPGGVDPASMALIVPPGSSSGQVHSEISRYLGRGVTASDLAGISNQAFSGGADTITDRSHIFDLTKLHTLVVDRFYDRIYAMSNVRAAYDHAQSANNERAFDSIISGGPDGDTRTNRDIAVQSLEFVARRRRKDTCPLAQSIPKKWVTR